MERVKFKNSRGLSLVGSLYSTDSKAIVIMAHGFTNNKSSQGRFGRLAESLKDLGYNVLAFDFSGCGESDPDIITASKEVDDLKSAIEFVKSKGYRKIALFGNSLGSLICLKSFRTEIVTMVLTGALTDSMKYNWDEFFSKEQLEELEQEGYLTMEDEKLGTRRVGSQMLLDFEEINQKELLKDVTCPVLIIHGNSHEDQEERQLLQRSKRAMNMLSEDSKLVVIEGGKHGLKDNYDQVIDLTKDWYLKFLKR